MSIFTHDTAVLATVTKIFNQLTVTNRLLEKIVIILKTPDPDPVEPKHLVVTFGPVTKQKRK